jgi:uncharacterized cofD-like protein
MKIVTIGGGSGQFSLLSGLIRFARKNPDKLKEENISAVVSTADTGGHTGKLLETRKPKDAEGRFLPPGDIRQCLAAMANDEVNKSFFQFRNEEGATPGNDFLNSAFDFFNKDFTKAIEFARKFLNVKGNVYPTSRIRALSGAILSNGKKVLGQEQLVVKSLYYGYPISELFLENEVEANRDAVNAILESDKIILSQGSIYSSLIPNLLVKGIPEAIRNSKAQKIYIVNIVTQRGETDGFTVKKHIETVEKYLGKGVIDKIIVNSSTIPAELEQRYKIEGQHRVENDCKNDSRIILAELLRDDSSVLRHDPDKLAEVIMKL